MREEIEQAIYAQRDAVKAEQEGEDNAALLKEAEEIFVDQSLKLHLATMHPKTKPETAEKLEQRWRGKAREVFQESVNLQRKKQEIMRRLRAELEALRKDPNRAIETSEEGLNVVADAGILYVEWNGEKKQLTFGDIVADAEWGLKYNLASSVPLNMRKRYLLELAKRSLMDVFNHQLALVDPHAPPLLHGKEKVDGWIREGLKKESEKSGVIGLLAERIAYAFFLRKSYDSGGQLKVAPTDFYRDIHEKVDFILQKYHPEYKRGVIANADYKKKKLGVQFTTRNKPGKLQRKQTDIEKALAGDETDLDDIIILQIPGRWSIKCFDKWFEAGKPPGGPEQFLHENKQRRMFKLVLERMFTPEEIEELKARVFGRRQKETERTAA